MLNTIYLTAEEKPLFEKFSDELKEGWEVKEEIGIFKDSSQKSRIRQQLLRIHDPKIQAFVEEANKTKNEIELSMLIQNIDLTGISETEIGKLFFVLGPNPIGVIIKKLMQEVKNDEDIKDIAVLTVVRNGLLRSLNPNQ